MVWAGRVFRPLRRASMGPPLFSGGNCGHGRGRDGGVVASMGPPLFSGGNVEYWRYAGRRIGMLQWGRRCSAAEIGDTMMLIGQGVSGFNGAAAVQRRKSSNSRRNRGPQSRFNGAAAVQRRKYRRKIFHEPASNRFNGAAAVQRRKFDGSLKLVDGATCFNGAAAVQRRK